MTAPEKPTLEGLEERWTAVWEHDGTYRFDRTKTRAEIFSIDTPPPTVSGALHPGHVCSLHATPTWSPATSACAGTRSSTRWAGTTTASTSSAASSSPMASRATPRSPTTRPSSRPRRRPRGRSRLAAQLRRAVRRAHRAARAGVLRAVDPTSACRSTGARPTPRSARRLDARRSERSCSCCATATPYLAEAPTLWDVDFKTVGRAGRARGPRASRRVPPHRVHEDGRRRARLHRDHSSRAARRVRRARRPPRRRALPTAVRHRRPIAAVRASRSRSSPTSSPIPRRGPASR